MRKILDKSVSNSVQSNKILVYVEKKNVKFDSLVNNRIKDEF